MNVAISIFFRGLFLAAVVILLPGLVERTGAQDKKAPAGKHVSADAMLLVRAAPGKPWQPVKQGAELYTGDLIVAQPGAAIDSRNGAVRLSLLSDLEGTSPFPVLESAVILNAAEGVDCDFSLDRGRVDVANRKEKGAARIRIRFHKKQAWELTLNEPGSKAGLELYGRWPRGVFFNKDAKVQDEPTAELVLIVLKGSVDLKHGNQQLGLQAPPGPAFFHWDSVAGPDPGPQRLEKLPVWADPDVKPSKEAKEREARMARFREKLAAGAPEAVAAGFLKSKDKDERRMAVIALGAVDDLGGLRDALNSTEHADVRENAVMVLRHWIGRGPGQDLKLYNFLVKEKKYPPAHAEIALRLLHSFGEADLGRPETYEALIAYLMHERVGIRELARWHLYRMVAAAKDIAYDAAGPEKDRKAAQDKWRQLIPEGKLPPRPKLDEPKKEK